MQRFTKDSIFDHDVEVPFQTNNYNCGIFLLQYAETFLMVKFLFLNYLI
jgi:hypothetical protein